jgi:hypothetical protein
MRRKSRVTIAAESRYWRESTAQVMVDAWRESGETVAAFARRQGVERRRLARWIRRVDGKADVLVPFHPVRVVDVPAETRQSEAPIEIVVGSPCRVRVPPGFEGDDLRRVLAVLAGGSC